MWLLVEWVDERNLFPSYGVVNMEYLMKGETYISVGILVFVRAKNGNSARRAQILRISENKRQLKEYKSLLERQDHKVKNVVTLCMQTIKGIKTEPLNIVNSIPPPPSGVGASGSGTLYTVAKDTTSSDDDVEAIIPEPSSHNLQMAIHAKYVAMTHARIESASVPVHRSQSINQSLHQNWRPQMNSEPLPTKREEKLFLDQGTQTDVVYTNPPIEKIERMEVALNKLYANYLMLVRGVQERAQAASVQLSDAESERDEHLDDQPQVLPNGQYLNDSNVDVERNEQQSNRRILHVRRVSAQTTNNAEPRVVNNATEMVPIGTGSVTLPAMLINQINWNCYSAATRKLMRAVFPRRILATHSLTGKQSPGFADIPPKRKLDARIIDDVVITVMTRCGVPRRLVRASITNMCADEARMYRNRNLDRPPRQVLQESQNEQPSPQSSPESMDEID